jgi:membrane protease subunit HflK
VSMLSASIPIQYEINDLKAWAYKYADAGQLLEKLATRELVRYLVGVDLNEIMSTGREQAANELRERIQTSAKELDLGVNILFVCLQDIHPPVKVAHKYEEVVAAMQEKEAKILEAEAYAAKEVPVAHARAERKVLEAGAYRARRVPLAAAQASRFANQITAFQASPRFFMQRSYLETLARGLTGARKYVLTSTNGADVIMLDLQDKVRPDLLDIEVPPANAK